MMTSKVVRTPAERGLVQRRTHESGARAVRIARALAAALFGGEPATPRGAVERSR